VYHSQYLRPLTLGIALFALADASFTASPALAEAIILVDVESGKVLRAENATYPWYPASVTKLMTLSVADQDGLCRRHPSHGRQRAQDDDGEVGQ
jgi:D-alanyl-D-alanine carboxypeptidase